MPFPNAEGVVYETRDAVICHRGCGRVALSEEEYDHQLNQPDWGWRCPKCGDSATWDDHCPTTNPPE